MYLGQLVVEVVLSDGRHFWLSYACSGRVGVESGNEGHFQGSSSGSNLEAVDLLEVDVRFGVEVEGVGDWRLGGCLGGEEGVRELGNPDEVADLVEVERGGVVVLGSLEPSTGAFSGVEESQNLVIRMRNGFNFF